MPQVTPGRIEPGDARDAASLNNVLTALSAGTTSVGSANLRDEGLDRRNVADESIVEYPSGNDVTFGGPSLLAVTTTWTGNQTVGGTLVRTTGAVTVAANEKLVIDLSGQWEANGNGIVVGDAPGVPAGDVCEVCIAYRQGGTTYRIGGTVVGLGHSNLDEIGDFHTWAELPAGSYTWVEMQLRSLTGAINVQIASGQLLTKIVKRVS